MVETRGGSRRDAQSELKNSAKVQKSKPSRVTRTNQTRNKAIQEAVQKDEIVAKSKGRQRAKKEPPSYLQRSVEAKKDPNRNIRLLGLPRDLFNEIISWLEPDAVTCLSLTCKEILGIVGREAWAECHSKQRYYDQNRHLWCQFRQTLIPILGRDVLHLTACDVCMTLHPPLKPPAEHRETKLTKHCFGPWSAIDYLPKDGPSGYSLLWEHVAEARKSMQTLEPEDKVGDPIKLLDGQFTVQHKLLTYTLNSCGRQIQKNLILKHEHIFRGINPRSPLRAADIINIPVRLCPHQTTSTEQPERGRYTKSRLPSGLLSHSIAIAVPPSLRVGIPKPSAFSEPISSEKKQMNSVVSGVGTLWTCRACPTKWRVQHSGEGAGELKITAWHSFGDTDYRAQEYWKMLVRREVSNLGAEKRNSEFFIVTKQYLDFAIDEED